MIQSKGLDSHRISTSLCEKLVLGMKELALAGRVAKIKYEIRDIVSAAKKVQQSGKKIHWFNIGDPVKFGFSPPSHVTQAIRAALDDPKYAAYCASEGDFELVEAVAKMEGVGTDSVFITNGLSEGIDFLFQALVNAGDNIMLPVPSYPLYNTKCDIIGGTQNCYQCLENWDPDPSGIRKSINKKTKAIVVINPNNPTGAVYSRKVLEEIVGIAGEHGLPIIADEIYDQLAFDGEKPVNMRTISKDVPLISGNGISKNYLYPGARVGYLAVHGQGTQGLKSALLKLCNQRLSVNWEMQRGALAAFTGSSAHIAPTLKKLRERRDVVARRVSQIEGLELVAPKAAFYAFVKINSKKFKTDKEFVYSLLEKTGVLVVPGSSFSPCLKGNYFRMVFLAMPEELNEAFDKIEKFMESK